MSKNTNIEAIESTDIVETVENTATKYTLDYALEQIENLRRQITENQNHSLQRLKEAVSSIYGNESEESDADVVESRNSSVYSVCEVFKDREDTLCRLLTFYEKMYDDLKPKATPEPDPVNEAIERMVAEFVSQKADYVADRSHEVNAEEFESIFKEIEQVRYLRERN